MNRNTKLSIAALLLVVLGIGGLFVGYKGYKKYKAKQNQEFRFEGTMGQVRDGFDKDVFKQAMLTDELLDAVIEKHALVELWETGDTATAKAKIREKFIVKVDAMIVKVSYQDKNKELSKAVLQSIVNGYYAKVKGGKLPSAPPATGIPASP